MLSGFANTNTAIKRSQGLQNFSINRLKVKTIQYVTHLPMNLFRKLRSETNTDKQPGVETGVESDF